MATIRISGIKKDASKVELHTKLDQFGEITELKFGPGYCDATYET